MNRFKIRSSFWLILILGAILLTGCQQDAVETTLSSETTETEIETTTEAVEQTSTEPLETTEPAETTDVLTTSEATEPTSDETTENLQTKPEETEAPMAPDIISDYSDYSGSWSLNVDKLYAMSAMEVYYGMTRMDLEILPDGTTNGDFYSVSGAPSYREAHVSFTGKFENGVLKTDYEDEAWLYKGTLTLTLDPENLSALQVETTYVEDENFPSWWSIPIGKFRFGRAIETEFTELSNQDMSTLTHMLSLMTQDRMPPFEVKGNSDNLTDVAKINFIGLNIADGKINIAAFGDLAEEGAEIVFDESVMQQLLETYIGTTVETPQSTTFVTYENGKYRVPAIGGVTESPEIRVVMKDLDYMGRYYLIVDYRLPGSETLEYQNLITVEFYNGYHMRGIERIDEPVEIDFLNEMRD